MLEFSLLGVPCWVIWSGLPYEVYLIGCTPSRLSSAVVLQARSYASTMAASSPRDLAIPGLERFSEAFSLIRMTDAPDDRWPIIVNQAKNVDQSSDDFWTIIANRQPFAAGQATSVDQSSSIAVDQSPLISQAMTVVVNVRGVSMDISVTDSAL